MKRIVEFLKWLFIWRKRNYLQTIVDKELLKTIDYKKEKSITVGCGRKRRRYLV